MLDYKIRTFLKVCETMNYRKAAEELNMSQPSITQHIHSLEQYYNCKLFIYDRKHLIKTEQATILERFSLSMRANEKILCNTLLKQPKMEIRIGATKSIGNYVINDKIKSLYDNYKLTFVIDNTYNLLSLLEKNDLDILLVEGLFDKSIYEYKLYKIENFVGICSKTSPLLNRKVSFKELFGNNLILREKGSGTREIFEQELRKSSYSINQFKSCASISSFDYILDFVKDNKCISF
ncbi:MAG: LysR family transcriptional regulator, partial [Spirochaetaceae bacterium]|nr:LysR family transcriptional regulator [Spirochaetaceae bacterium]